VFHTTIANASNGPTDYANLIEMLREDIPALSLVTTESILYDGATMRLVKTALNQSGHTVYQLPGQSNLEALIDELYSSTPDQHNTVLSLYRARVAELSRVTTATTNKPSSNYSELKCPSRPTPPPSSSQRQVYRDNSNCPPSPIPPQSSSRQVSFRDNPINIPINNSSNSQDVRAQQIQPTAPVHESTAILEPPVSQNNSFLNRSQSRNNFLLNNSSNCNLNLTPEVVNSEHNNSSTSSSYVMGLTSPAELQMAAAVRIAHQVSQRFNQKGAKYAGGMDESLEDKFLTYRTIARDYQLRNSQRVELIHNLFDEEALRFYNNHVLDKANTIEEVSEMMSKEFNSITRQEKVKNQLLSLKLHHLVELKGMTANEALDHIQAKINAMLPQCPKEFNHDSY
jgi:hypothetical protein